jgi:hypothetical protein
MAPLDLDDPGVSLSEAQRREEDVRTRLEPR